MNIRNQVNYMIISYSISEIAKNGSVIGYQLKDLHKSFNRYEKDYQILLCKMPHFHVFYSHLLVLPNFNNSI